jgi:biotin carboxylase
VTKTLWIVSGGIEAVPGIRHARELGFHVVVSDFDPEAPGFSVADDRIVESTYDVDATVAAALKYHETVRPVDGVMAMAADIPLTVASVADALGLPGTSLEAAKLASDKLLMKERFAEHGIPVPWFSSVESFEQLISIVADQELPLVLKPVDSRGARGVLRLTEETDLSWAFEHSRSQSPTERVMVERYLAGPQISTESVLLGDVAATPGFIDRNYEHLDRFAPYVVENGGEQPTRLSPKDRQAVSELAERAGRAMGIERGTVKGDLVLTEAGPHVIEMAARLSGGWMSTDQIPLATGVDLIGIAVRLAVGEDVTEEEVTPRAERGVAIRYFFPDPGRVERIEGAANLEDTPWVHRLGFFVAPGDVVEPTTDHTKRAGFVIASGGTRDEAVGNAVRVVETVRIVTDPLAVA